MAGKRQKKKIKTEKLQQNLDMPKILKPSVPHLELEGNEELMIDGCKGILAYEEDYIRLNADSLVITVKGETLNIQNYTENQSEITGKIIAIEFST